jgi:hypothetical protein
MAMRWKLQRSTDSSEAQNAEQQQQQWCVSGKETLGKCTRVLQLAKFVSGNRIKSESKI